MGEAVSTLFGRSSWGSIWLKMYQNEPKWPFQNLPKWTQNRPLTTPNHPQETRHHTPRQPRHDTHLHSGHGVGKCAPRGAGGGRSGRAFSHPMAAVEVCVVAWLAWGVVAGLLGVVGGDSGPPRTFTDESRPRESGPYRPQKGGEFSGHCHMAMCRLFRAQDTRVLEFTRGIPPGTPGGYLGLTSG